jgi:hypothetical protein
MAGTVAARLRPVVGRDGEPGVVREAGPPPRLVREEEARLVRANEDGAALRGVNLAR